MERSPVEITREIFERFNAGDYEVVPEWTDPRIEIHSSTASLAGEPYRGYAGVRAWIDDMFEAFDEWTLRLDELQEYAPGRIFCVGAVHFRGRGSQVSVDEPTAWIYEFADGRCTRIEIFRNRVDEARAAAGLAG